MSCGGEVSSFQNSRHTKKKLVFMSPERWPKCSDSSSHRQCVTWYFTGMKFMQMFSRHSVYHPGWSEPHPNPTHSRSFQISANIWVHFIMYASPYYQLVVDHLYMPSVTLHNHHQSGQFTELKVGVVKLEIPSKINSPSGGYRGGSRGAKEPPFSPEI